MLPNNHDAAGSIEPPQISNRQRKKIAIMKEKILETTCYSFPEKEIKSKVVRALQKKLRDINILLSKQENNLALDEQQLNKIASLDNVMADLQKFTNISPSESNNDSLKNGEQNSAENLKRSRLDGQEGIEQPKSNNKIRKVKNEFKSDEQTLPAIISNHTNISNKEYRILVSGLPFSATIESVKTFFASCGSIVDIHLPKKKSVRGTVDQPTGIAFIKFSSSDEIKNALDKNGQNFPGRINNILFLYCIKLNKINMRKVNQQSILYKPYLHVILRRHSALGKSNRSWTEV